MTPCLHRFALATLAALASFAALAADPAASAAPASTAAPAASAALAALPKPADLVGGMDPSLGLISFYRKEDKAFASIPRALLGAPLWVSANLRKGLGIALLYPNTMGPSWIARFRLGPNRTLQLVADNARPLAPGGGAYAKLAEASYAQSLIGSWPLKAIDDDILLVDGNAFAMADLGSWPARLEAALKTPYAFDAPNSQVGQIANSAVETVFSIQANYTAAKLVAGAPAAPLPDARSALLETVLSFSSLPALPMPTRLANERVGFFQAQRKDLTPAAKPHQQRQSYIARWRLELADPSALSGQVKTPIRFEICPEMPERYRAAVREGILRWSPAFDKIGLFGAIEVEQIEVDASIIAGGRRASVCFVAGDDANTAYGPSKLDPRTGEILEARVIIPEIFATIARFEFASRSPKTPTADEFGNEDLAVLAGSDWAAVADAEDWGESGKEAYAQSQVAAIIAHEIGHALGLRHNFKGSAAYPFSRISAPGYQGPITASVMDYLPANIYPGRDQASAIAHPRTIGAYDEWAIAYAYSPFVDAAAESDGLARILARADVDPLLAFASDEDAHGADALDPKAALFDLSANPIDFARSRFELAQSSIDRMARKARMGTLDPFAAYHALPNLLLSTSRYADIIPRYFGGAKLTRQEGRSPVPSLGRIEPAEQRDAMAFLTQTVLGSYLDAPPELLARAVGPASSRGASNPSLEWENKIGEIQSKAIRPFFTPALTDQIMDSQRWGRQTGSAPTMSLREVEQALMLGVWGELWQGKPIDRARRELQRAYANLLATAIKTPANLSQDPRALFRELAERIEAQARKESTAPSRSPDERAHLRDVETSLSVALKPALNR